MKKRTVKRRRKQWSLAKLCDKCPSVALVWLALLDMAAERGSSVLTPTRETLARATGIRKHRTISKSLTRLEDAAWIDRVHVPVVSNGQRKTLLRLILRRKGPSRAYTKQSAVEAPQGPKGRGPSRAHDFPKGKGADTAPPLMGADGTTRGCAAQTADAEDTTEHPSVRIERERLAVARVEHDRCLERESAVVG